MSWIIWIYAIAALFSALAAVLAWAAKLWWAKEFKAAKDETIKAKDAQIELLKTQIEGLRELSPMKVREYFLSVKEQLEEFINDLQNQLQEARADIEQKSELIGKLQNEGRVHEAEVKRLSDEIANLEAFAKAIEGEGSKLLNTFARSHELAHYWVWDFYGKESVNKAVQERKAKTGEVCQRSGLYACTVHPSNTIPLAKGNRFPPCSLDNGHATTWVQTSISDTSDKH
jgi:hypothetical protein